MPIGPLCMGAPSIRLLVAAGVMWPRSGRT